MALELLLLCALIFIFIVSFCGLLQKIKQSYDRERLIAERVTRRQAAERNSAESFSEVYMNSAYIPDARNHDGSGIYPAAPPPYTQNCDAPPKYEDVIKTQTIDIPEEVPRNSTQPVPPPRRPSTSPPAPAYTISTDPLSAPRILPSSPPPTQTISI